ncbi:three-Cys-motif partner protein TcmP [Azospirillum sp. B4]|uniref:three-Cys-motif partner protein TcmP n=1 Tax=Azospirillum sp. B4 TaxID=95605 RepID=UPI000A058E61|nr:three-Cys-motif partner protein TcmP [Azospirillum sp. B4]
MATSKAVWRIGKTAPNIEPHTLAKHRVVQRYIERYLEIVTQNRVMNTLRITFVDGYCGGGRYTDGKDLFPGSPLIFLSTVTEMESRLAAQRAKGFNIRARYIFIDSEKRHIEFLRAEIEKTQFKDMLDKEISLWVGDFNDLVDNAIIEAKKNSQRVGCSIFLLDQFGWSQVALESIRKILNNLPKSEVFLTFMVDALANYISESNHDLSAFERIDISPDLVREMIRFKEEDYLGARVLIQNFLYDHIRKQTGAPYYSPFMIKSPESHRSHWLLHLSKHHEARNEIGEIHWQENNTTTHHGRGGFYSLGFTPTGDINQFMIESLMDDHARKVSREALIEEIPHLIEETLAQGKPVSLVTLFGSRCSDTPLVRSLIEPELLRLRDNHDLIIKSADGKLKPRSKSLEWTDRYEFTKEPTFFSKFLKKKEK